VNELMERVYWALGEKAYAAYGDFVTAVAEYNNVIAPGENEWTPNRVISANPVKVIYEALWKDEDDTINLDIGTPGIPVTMGQLLFALNNATCDFFRDADTHFFEGLALVNNTTYRLLVGS
jgi:hypothetical protein